MFRSLFNETLTNLPIFMVMNIFTSLILYAINMTYKEPLILDLVKEPLDPNGQKPKYDVVLIDAFFGEIYLPLAHHLGVPSILISSSVLLASFSWSLNVPHHYFFNYAGYQQPMDIFSRTKTLLFHILYLCSFVYLDHKMEAATTAFLPNSLPLYDLKRNISFVMTANNPSILDSVPTTPYVVDVECLHCRPAKPLPLELEEVIQKSGEHGVIYFTMGSFVRPDWIPDKVMKSILEILSQLPQTILWKGDLNKRNLSNFYVSQWFPQQDLLAHPKLHLVITHGGLGTFQEASYHACPTLGLPVITDQGYNMHIAKKHGYGEFLDWRTFSHHEFYQTIKRMLTITAYKEAAMKVSLRMKEHDTSGQAAYWTEYIIRHKGAPFLKSNAHHLNWYQYFLLDVLALVVITSAVIITLCWWTVKLGFRVIRFAFFL